MQHTKIQSMNRYKPHGWRYESHRHSLAARGISSKYYARMSEQEQINVFLKHNKDFKDMNVDEQKRYLDMMMREQKIRGNEGIANVYRQFKKRIETRGYFSKNTLPFGTTKNEQALPFIERNMDTQTEGDGLQQFKEDVAEMARHPMKDLDGEWEEYTSLAENKPYGKYGVPEKLSDDKVLRAQQRAAALFGRVVSQANVEPLVDKRECDRSVRDIGVDFLFGRRVR